MSTLSVLDVAHHYEEHDVKRYRDHSEQLADTDQRTFQTAAIARVSVRAERRRRPVRDFGREVVAQRTVHRDGCGAGKLATGEGEEVGLW